MSSHQTLSDSWFADTAAWTKTIAVYATRWKGYSIEFVANHRKRNCRSLELNQTIWCFEGLWITFNVEIKMPGFPIYLTASPDRKAIWYFTSAVPCRFINFYDEKSKVYIDVCAYISDFSSSFSRFMPFYTLKDLWVYKNQCAPFIWLWKFRFVSYLAVPYCLVISYLPENARINTQCTPAFRIRQWLYLYVPGSPVSHKTIHTWLSSYPLQCSRQNNHRRFHRTRWLCSNKAYWGRRPCNTLRCTSHNQ